MRRQSVSFSNPNSEWLRHKIEVEGEYASCSEAVNDLIRQARGRERAETAAIRAALIEGERSGLGEKSLDDIWQEAKDRLKARNA